MVLHREATPSGFTIELRYAVAATAEAGRPTCAISTMVIESRPMKGLFLVGILLLVLPLASAAEASAQHSSPEVFHEGYLSSAVGHRHTLWEVTARLLSGGGSTNIVCVNALEDSGALSGDYVCAGTADNSLAVHPFCNCAWRRGYATAYYPQYGVNARAREAF